MVRLDLPDDVLGRLDLVVGAVHSRFNLSKQQQTDRILKAMGHPHFPFWPIPVAVSSVVVIPTKSICCASSGRPGSAGASWR